MSASAGQRAKDKEERERQLSEDQIRPPKISTSTTTSSSILTTLTSDITKIMPGNPLPSVPTPLSDSVLSETLATLADQQAKVEKRQARLEKSYKENATLEKVAEQQWKVNRQEIIEQTRRKAIARHGVIIDQTRAEAAASRDAILEQARTEASARHESTLHHAYSLIREHIENDRLEAEERVKRERAEAEERHRLFLQQLASITQLQSITTARVDETVARVTTVEQTIDTLNQVVTPLTTEVAKLTDTVRQLQTNHSGGSFSGNQSTNVLAQSMLATSMFRPERLQDVVPEFSGNLRGVHPDRFIAEIEHYFMNTPNAPLTDEQRLHAFQRRLTHDARMWYDSLMPVPSTYSDFLICFRQQFWSADIQRRVYDDIYRPYQYRSSQGLASHAMQWITKAKYLNPPIHQLSLVNLIIQHYPANLAVALRGRGPRTTNELLSILTEFENTTSFNEHTSPRSSENPPATSNRNNTSRRDYTGNYQGRGGYVNSYNRRGGDANTQNERESYQNHGNNRRQNQQPSTSQATTGPSPTVQFPSAAVHQLNVSGNDNEART